MDNVKTSPLDDSADQHRHVGHLHDHGQCIDDALARAKQLCVERGSRFTPLRQKVLELIWQSHKAVKAYDIIELMSSKRGTVKPPTVYRALDFLIEHGLVHKIESLNAYVGCPFGGSEHVSQFLICDRCSDVTEICSVRLSETVQEAARAGGFHLSGQTIELHGLCKICAGAKR